MVNNVVIIENLDSTSNMDEKELFSADPILNNIIRQIPKPIIPSTYNVFHDLMSCVIEQQIHYRSTKKIFQKMLNKADLQLITPDNFQIFEEKSFTDSNLSNSKYETIASILHFWDTHNIDWLQLSDEEIIATLSTIKGIGKWTIDMILLYTLQRSNVFPYDDYHLKQIMSKLYGLDPKVKLKAKMIEISENWGNQKSTAVLYLLAWKTRK